MDPLTVITVEAISRLAQPELLLKITEQIGKKLTDAKKKYQSTPKDLNSPIEQKREKLLGSLSELQAQVMMYMSNQPQFAKITTILLDQTTEVYDAQTEQDLALIELSLRQIKGAVKQYQKIAARRVLARWLAVIVSILALIGLGGLMYWGTLGDGPSLDTMLPIIHVPLPILLWSTIGSLTAILYRFNSSGDIELQDPLRWLFTRPLTGIVMGIIAYFVVLVGLISIASSDAPSTVRSLSSSGSAEILWLVAFIAGFSDRFADGILRTLVGRFGGNTQNDLITLDGVPSNSILAESIPLLDGLIKKRKGILVEDTINANRATKLPVISPGDESQNSAQTSAAKTNLATLDTIPNDSHSLLVEGISLFSRLVKKRRSIPTTDAVSVDQVTDTLMASPNSESQNAVQASTTKAAQNNNDTNT